jgi:hypothetical protein
MAPINVQQWLELLDKQRRMLKMPLDIVAERANLSLATVNRILKKKRTSSSIENVFAIASVLGAEIGADGALRIQDPEKMVEQQIQKEAKKIVRMVQGTMALEAQGITDSSFLDQLVETAAQELRRKPRKKLWVRSCRPSSRSQAKPPSTTSPN